MFDLDRDLIEDKIKKTDKKITEIEIRNQKLDQDTKELLAEFQVTSEQLTQYLQSEENFSKKNWKELQEHKDNIEKKLNTDLNCIFNPKQAKTALKERNIGHHWLFVK